MNLTVVKEIVKLQPKTFVVIGLLLFTNFCLYLFSSAYQLPRMETLQGKLLEKRSAISHGAALDISAEYRKGLDDLKAWRARILPKRDFASFVGGLYDTAHNDSLVINGISYKATELNDEGLAAYSMTFNVSGKYAATKSFIYDIQRIREITTIDSISLSNNKSTEDNVSLKVQMTVYLRVGEQ